MDPDAASVEISGDLSREDYERLIAANGDSEAMAAKIVDGRMNKWYEEVCLLDQGFLGDDKNKNRSRVAAVEKELGAKIEVVRFSRLVMGEGIEKKESDFAAEVAAQAGLK
jgi:elongation factor Ts